MVTGYIEDLRTSPLEAGLGWNHQIHQRFFPHSAALKKKAREKEKNVFVESLGLAKPFGFNFLRLVEKRYSRATAIQIKDAIRKRDHRSRLRPERFFTGIWEVGNRVRAM